MISPEAEKQLEPLRAYVKEQGEKIRNMKTSGAAELDIKREVQILKTRKKELEDMVLKLCPVENFDRAKMTDLIKRRFFYDISFAIYGGITGQYDFGPMGCVIVDNMLAEWQNHFVVQEHMLKVNCSILTPETVLKASGHVDKFADYMVKDTKSGECFRLDHLIKQQFERILLDKKTTEETKKIIERKITLLDDMSMNDMNNIIKEYEMKSPSTGNDLTDATEFNLMFPISIGPTGHLKGFLRPETAQGIFVNFKRLYEYNQRKIPFACAQIGNSYRNEISPRSGLLRVREFTMAEIEHFCYPDDKQHSKFYQVADTKLWLYSACNQMDGESPKLISIGEAVKGSGLDSLGMLETFSDLVFLNKFLEDKSYLLGSFPSQTDITVYKCIKGSLPSCVPHLFRWFNHIKSFTPQELNTFPGKICSLEELTGGVKKGLVANETLGYYMARIQQFLIKIGIHPEKLRFRQHLNNEMAHYACDCWDAECLTSYGWIECVGCADRSAYDLGQHTKATGVRLSVERGLTKPRSVDSVTPVLEKGSIGKAFKKDAKIIQEKLAAMSSEEVEKLEQTLLQTGEYLMDGSFLLTRAMIPSVKRETKEVHVEEIIPSVIEPSFGIGRIFYSLLEHTFKVREDDANRTYFSLPPIIAPVKVSVLPLSNKPEFNPFIDQLVDAMTTLNISLRVDDSTGSIGKRYSRTDEIAIPFGVTIDFDTINNSLHTVTVRERDSTLQVRMPIDEVPTVIQKLSDGKITWEEVMSKYPKFVSQETTK